MIIGIDPGVGGAVAFLFDNGSVRVDDMPICAKDVGKGNQVNAWALSSLFVDVLPATLVAIERVGPMPKQGVTSVFSFGRSVGVVEGIVAARGWRVIYVRPQAWKKRFGLVGKDKDAARTRALQLYPGAADRLKRKKDVDRAEAILIAEYAKTIP